MNKIHENPWWRNPSWWSCIIAAAQFLLISVCAALVGWFLKEREQQQYLVSMAAQLEEGERDKYRAAGYALIRQGPTGIAEIKAYTERVGCIPWEKARFLYSRLRLISGVSADRRDAINILWSAWVCNRANLGVDVELYEAMQREPEIACDAVVNKKLDLPDKFFFDQVALLAVILSACPQKTSSELQSLNAKVTEKFESCFGSGVTPTGQHVSHACITFDVWLPWMPRIPGFTGPFDAEEDSWRTVVAAIQRLFSQHSSGALALSRFLGSEPLFSRIIFGMLVSMKGTPRKDESVDVELRKSFAQWLEMALRSKDDSESKYAALSAIGNLNLQQFKDRVDALAETEPDTSLRERASAVSAGLP